MSRAVESLPKHLLKYIDQQNYSDYTPRDHAVWRYILKQNLSFFGKKGFAVSEYAKGLELTGIPLDRIPEISYMDQALDRFNWGAVPVCGFIPPVAFLEFQAYGVLPIAHNMRSIDQIGYTPAPDIVHESAGHAPILVNETYAAYLKKYAHVAGKAIASKQYFDQYEAIRKLSDLKALDNVNEDDLKNAEAEFERVKNAEADVSEASQIVRLYWWTAEYGLMGSMQSPKVFGAGLLSSVEESQNCLKAAIKKIPFSIDCIHYGYDITKPQPQLFVVNHFEDLMSVLSDLEKHLAYCVGGVYGLNKAKSSDSVVTLQWQNGVFISCVVNDFDEVMGTAEIVDSEGPYQIGIDKDIVENYLIPSHSQLPIPMISPQKILMGNKQIKIQELKLGEIHEFVFNDFFKVKGKLLSIIRNKKNEVVLLKFEAANIVIKNKTIEEKIYYMPIQCGQLISVYGGPFQQDTFMGYDVGLASTKPIRSNALNNEQHSLFESYQRVHSLQKLLQPSEFKRLCGFMDYIFDQHNNEWLLWLEAIEILHKNRHLSYEMSAMKREAEERIENNLPLLTHHQRIMLQKGLNELYEK